MKNGIPSFPRAAVLAVVSLAMLGGGCADNVKAPIAAREDPYQREQIHMTSLEVRRHTAVEAPILTRDDGGLLFVTVPVRAATDQKLYVDYRVTFFDRAGGVLNQTGWLHKTLPPNTPDQITFNSTSPRAVDFQMDLREAE
jgi:hypothetical protein